MELVSTISILSGTLGPHPADGISAKRLKQLKSLIAKHGLANSLRFIEDVNGISSASKDREKRWLRWWGGTPTIHNACSGQGYVTFEVDD